MNFSQKVKNAWYKNNSLVCVGLDPDPKRFPDQFAGKNDAIFAFNRAIIDATADLVCSFKPQIAHYAALGAEDQLLQTIQYIHENRPDIPVILDSKRGDIGSTAEKYADEAFQRFEADAVTINPYLGFDSIEPFSRHADKGVIVLCRTSNPSSASIQNLTIGEQKLYEKIAEMAVNDWNENSNISLVVGATNPEELGKIRAIVGDMMLLVPGIGAQGGDTQAAISNGQDEQGAGLMVNSSRGVLYASQGPDFADAARQVTEQMRDEINQYRKTV